MCVCVGGVPEHPRSHGTLATALLWSQDHSSTGGGESSRSSTQLRSYWELSTVGARESFFLGDVATGRLPLS